MFFWHNGILCLQERNACSASPCALAGKLQRKIYSLKHHAYFICNTVRINVSGIQCKQVNSFLQNQWQNEKKYLLSIFLNLLYVTVINKGEWGLLNWDSVHSVQFLRKSQAVFSIKKAVLFIYYRLYIKVMEIKAMDLFN